MPKELEVMFDAGEEPSYNYYPINATWTDNRDHIRVVYRNENGELISDYYRADRVICIRLVEVDDDSEPAQRPRTV